MNLKNIVMNLRTSKKMKGKYPCVVFIIANKGGISGNKSGYYVMTFHENELWFHGLTKFFHRYDSSKDFGLDLKKFVHYNLDLMSSRSKKFVLISYKGDYIPLGYFYRLKDSHETECNIEYIIDELKRKGITKTNLLESEIKEKQSN